MLHGYRQRYQTEAHGASGFRDLWVIFPTLAEFEALPGSPLSEWRTRCPIAVNRSL
jgi:hypothetical protein